MTMTMTRRQLLKTGGAVLVGFSMQGLIPKVLAADLPEIGQTPKDFSQQNAWLAIDGNGRVTVFSGHVELGTGVETALTQMSADELDVPFDAVCIVQGDTYLTPDQGPTWGSLSIEAAGLQLRKAAACARRTLLEGAATKLNVPVADLHVKDGVISGNGKQLSYAELVVGSRNVLDVVFDDKVPLKQANAFQIVGKSIPRVDIPGKVTGEFMYMQDFRLPGMLHGRVVRPAGIQASLKSVDDSEAKKVEGFVQTVVKGDFVGVVANTEWGAIKAMEAVKCEWSDWNGLPAMDKVYDVVKKTPIKQTLISKKVGDAGQALSTAAKKISATYEYPVQTHGSIGPSCSVADVRGDKVLIWSASQATHWLQRQMAAMLNMKLEQIRIIYLEGAGCYGRNGHEDASADAVVLSQAVGRPVRVQWMRQDEHGWDPKSPPYVADLQAGLDDQGNVVAWDFVTWLPNWGAKSEVPLLARSLQEGLAGVQNADNMMPGNMQSDAYPPYEFPNLLSTVQKVDTTPFRPSWLRGPGRMQNTFANECFMDELAAAAGADPVEFRLKYLKDQRGIACIKACTDKAGWDTRPSPREDIGSGVVKGRGFTYVFYDNKRTYVSAVCEVEVDLDSGKVHVTRFVISHDCGLIINPDGTKAQIEGCVVQTLSRTLMEEMKWDESHITSLDWGSYPIITFPEIPKIDIVLINRPDQPAWGAGEPACAVIPSSLSNAIFDATGGRVRTAPFTPERVKKALETAPSAMRATT
ncbi:xanthine dehydrogenase family protein molybdopterin-binding subunit [Alcaligenaceae bacterium]|nr:xanthine dehydrogenase family protein molybdopterin-binding subunit [Alcaligenaceae bacterium]